MWWIRWTRAVEHTVCLFWVGSGSSVLDSRALAAGGRDVSAGLIESRIYNASARRDTLERSRHNQRTNSLYSSVLVCRNASRCTWHIIGRFPCDCRVVIHAFHPNEILFFLDHTVYEWATLNINPETMEHPPSQFSK